MLLKNHDPSADGFHMPGEFEPHRGCIMIWPDRPGSWPFGAKAAKRVFAEVAAAISKSEKVYMLAETRLCAEAAEYLKPLVPEVKNSAIVAAEEEDVSGLAAAAKAKDISGLAAVTECSEKPYVPVVEIVPIPTDDAWARDVCPTFVVNSAGSLRGVSWRFNAWGGEYDGLYAHWEQDDACAGRVCDYLCVPCYDAGDFVLEGGSIHSDGEGTLLVTEACLLSPGRNPQLTKEEIEEKLKSYLGAKKVIWLPHGICGDETNEHVDNVCAFVRPGEVVLAWPEETAKLAETGEPIGSENLAEVGIAEGKENPAAGKIQLEYSRECLRVLGSECDAMGRKIIVHKLPLPRHPVCIQKEDLPGFASEEGEAERFEGEQLAASYVNFYIANRSVLVPQFHDVNDSMAVEILAKLFPEREIVPVYARDILMGGGNIHCITQPIP